MILRYYQYKLQFNHPFSISVNTRTSTPAVYVEIEENGSVGYGEAALPPYLTENTESVCKFLSQVDLTDYHIPFNPESIFQVIDSLASGNNAAKAAVDIALYDLYGKSERKSLKEIFNVKNLTPVLSTFTIGIGNTYMTEKKIKESENFKILKIKLNGNKDKERIEKILSQTDKSFCVDVNQGWNDKHYALKIIHFLAERKCLFIEQPLPKNKIDETAWLTEKSPVPVIADEAVQRLDDIEKIKGIYSGVNIKLMKSAGLTEARTMIKKASEINLKILIGCMSESSCAVTAAAHLSSLADWADLDGPFLIKNDPFSGIKVENGFVKTPDGSGTGATPNENYSFKKLLK